MCVALLDWTNSNAISTRRMQYNLMGGDLKDNEKDDSQKNRD